MTAQPAHRDRPPEPLPEPVAAVDPRPPEGELAARTSQHTDPGRLCAPGAERDLGMATAEYAITTLAACGFAGLLLVLLRGGEVRGLLLGLVRRALSVD